MSDNKLKRSSTMLFAEPSDNFDKPTLAQSNSYGKDLCDEDSYDEPVQMDYGSFVKNGFVKPDQNGDKTGFTFLGDARNSIMSHITGQSNIGTSTSIHAFLNLSKVFIGIGILTGPAAMSHCGIVLGVLGISVAGIMSLYSINIQAQTRHKLQAQPIDDQQEVGENDEAEEEREEAALRRQELDNSLISESDAVQAYINNYSELGRAAFGRGGFVFVSMCLFVQQMCSVTAYFAFIGSYIPIPIALSVIIPFCLFLNIKKISYLSLFSLCAIIWALGLVLYHSLNNIHEIPKDDVKYFDIMMFPNFFGVSIFIFEGNCASLQIETSMKEPRKFKWVSAAGIFFVVTMNWVLSSLAYYSYVNTIQDVVLFNLPPTTISAIVNMSYSFGLMFSIPIQIAPMVDTMYRTDTFDEYIPIFKEKPKSKYYVSVLIILFACVLFAILIPCLEMFINLSGALVGTLTLAIIPVMFYNKAFRNEISNTRLVIHYTMIVVMTIAGTVSIYHSLGAFTTA